MHSLEISNCQRRGLHRQACRDATGLGLKVLEGHDIPHAVGEIPHGVGWTQGRIDALIVRKMLRGQRQEYRKFFSPAEKSFL